MADRLHIDLETFSDIDLKECGVFKYVESRNFRILLMAYAYDDEPVQIIDLAQGEEIPFQLISDICSGFKIMKSAYNAQFERTCLTKYFDTPMFPDQWECSQVYSYRFGLPPTLGKVAEVLNLDVQKDTAGKTLINYFCKPCKPTKKNPNKTRNFPKDAPDKWEMFKSYCKTDVETERTLVKRLDSIGLNYNKDFEKAIWDLDQRINQNGFQVDPVLVRNAIKCDEELRSRLMKEAIELTGLDNPNSGTQLKKWLEEEEEENDEITKIKSLAKDKIPELVTKLTSERSKRVIEIRNLLSKSSIKKYYTMNHGMCKDERVRGLFQFYGANRTGRWAGRLVQVQNLPKNTMPDLEIARDLVRNGEFEMLEILFDNVPNTLSQLIRTAFIAPEKHEFIVTDFSAIEARVLAWVAKEEWRLEVFRTHGKIYEASAAAMFHVPLETIDKKSPLRQKGKVAELALGYQGSVGAMIRMGALKMGLHEEELLPIVQAWRKANPHIVRFWYDIEFAVKKFLYQNGKFDYAIKPMLEDLDRKPAKKLPIGMFLKDEFLFLRLPSGRCLAYFKPKLVRVKDRINIQYYGKDDKGFGINLTYGGKLTENIIQAISRDILAKAMLRLAKEKYKLVAHVHDEVILECLIGQHTLEEANDILRQPIKWAEGLPLNADGFVTKWYKKDD
jgi:DNA polymerase